MRNGNLDGSAAVVNAWGQQLGSGLRYCASGGVGDGVDEALQALELALVRTFEVQVDAIGIGANDFRWQGQRGFSVAQRQLDLGGGPRWEHGQASARGDLDPIRAQVNGPS